MPPKRIGLLLIDGYPMLSAAAATEPLRAANLFSDTPLYDMRILSTGGGRAVASSGSHFDAWPIGTAGTAFDLVFILAGGDPLAFRDAGTFAALRRLDAAGVALGGISGGAAILAAADLLGGRRFTLHWHHEQALRRRYPALAAERRIYVIDRDRYTCAGGSAPLDMMHQIITRDHGAAFAQRISDWFIQTEIRSAESPQQGGPEARFGPLPREVVAAISLMESHIADPLDLPRIAALVGLSERQLGRSFRKAFDAPVMSVYRRLRLEIADGLLSRSALDLSDVARMTGFVSQAHFSVRYRRHFGAPPSRCRQRT